MMPSLEELFSNGTLVNPAGEAPNLVHLVQAIASLTGVPDVERTGPVGRLVSLIGAAEHLVFVLADGLGMNLIRRLPPDSFLASHLRLPILATCPSTTACALTSVATGQFPAKHGVTGWFTHIPELKVTATILPFVDRFGGKSLSDRGLKVEDVIPAAPLLPRMRHTPYSLTPSYISDTAYNRFARGGTGGEGYKTIPDAVRQVVEHVKTAAGPSYSHLYIPDIDTLCHHVGVAHDDVVPLVQHIDAELRRLADKLAGRARIIVSADHGLIDVPKRDQALLFAGDPLLELLEAPPSGDARMPIFHLKPGAADAFRQLFQDRFGEQFALIEPAEAERLHLFGPSPLAPAVRRRFGDFIAFPFRPATIGYHPPDKPPGHLFLAVHGGLSPEEMWVPLSVI